MEIGKKGIYMNRFDKLRSEHNESVNNFKQSLTKVANEAGRVADVAHNTKKILNDIEKEFEQNTKLTKEDISFLFLAVALQCCRQYLFTNFKERPSDAEAAKNTLLENTVDPKDKARRIEKGLEERHHKLYNPSFDEILLHPVPFDTTKGSKNFGSPFSGAGKLGHRATAIGHDPILGLIFGTANIATSTLTTWDFKSFHVYSKTGKGGGDYLKSKASTAKIIESAQNKLINNVGPNNDGRLIMAFSLIKEIVHLRSDIHSKNSLPLPFISAVDPKLASTLAEYGLDMENIEIIGNQAGYAILINQIISLIHTLFYDESKDGSRQSYQIRTRKIILYSNLIATTSNILYTAIATCLGNTKEVRKLDVGGFMVTMYRLVTDIIFIKNIKKEFLEKEFYKKVMGDVNLMEEYK